jgi:hypothetical protein
MKEPYRLCILYSNVKEYKKINAEWYRRVMVRNAEE